jgi:hypothetical protein
MPASSYVPMSFGAFYPRTVSASGAISADWPLLRNQLLAQWRHITARELDKAGPNRYRIADLIESKYGIDSVLAENYLRNFERTLPFAPH